MKNLKRLLIGVFLASAVLTGLAMRGTLNAAGAVELSLKAACLRATIQAIGMQMKDYEMRIEAARKGPGDPANIPGFEKRIKELQADLEKFRAMKPENYQLPEKKTVSVTVRQPYREGSILDNDDKSRSGPFYHLAGIRNDDYTVLAPGQKYDVTIYLVYQRDYPFPDHFVYIDYGPNPAR